MLTRTPLLSLAVVALLVLGGAATVPATAGADEPTTPRPSSSNPTAPPPDVSPRNQSAEAPAGAVIEAVFHVRNPGNESATYSFALKSPRGWNASMDASGNQTFAPHESRAVRVQVHSPSPSTGTVVLTVLGAGGSASGSLAACFHATNASSCAPTPSRAPTVVLSPRNVSGSVGEQLAFVAHVTNPSNTARNVSVSLQLPLGWTGAIDRVNGTLAPGETVTLKGWVRGLVPGDATVRVHVHNELGSGTDALRACAAIGPIGCR